MEFKEAWDSERVEEAEEFSGRCGKFQQALWFLFDKPHTSLGARVIALISSIFIFTSVIILTLATLPAFTTEARDLQVLSVETQLIRTVRTTDLSPSSRPWRPSGSLWSSPSGSWPVRTREGKRGSSYNSHLSSDF